ncbi:MAG: MFS transporter [Succinivibrio sp.]|nr:MFS transporter [Succinivibrio sp.]
MQTNANKLSDPLVRPLIYTLIVCLMSPLFGFNLGFIFAYKPQFVNLFMLEDRDIDTIINIILLGMIAGFFFGSFLTNSSGRKTPIIGSFVLGTLSLCAMIFSSGISLFLLSEFALGACFGIYILTSIIFITEISLPVNRGFAGLLNAFFIALGTLIAILGKDHLPHSALTLAAIIIVYCLIVAAVAVIKLPESPRWLALSGFSEVSLSVLLNLRQDTGYAARELANINECCQGEDRGLSLFIHNDDYRRVIWYLAFITIMIHLCGAFIIPYHFLDIVKEHQEIFVDLIFPNNYDYDYTLVKSSVTVAFFGAVTALIASDRIGRRTIMLSALGMIIVIESILLFISAMELSKVSSLFMAGFLLIFVYAASMLIYCFFYVIVSEVLPVRGRELGVAAILFLNAILWLIGEEYFAMFTASLGQASTLIVEIVAASFLLIAVYKGLPNTAGKKLEAMENQLFASGTLSSLH